MNNITEYQKCDCGAVTIYFENGAYSSMYQRTAKKLHIDLRHYKRIPQSFCCDHCINHWGIDLCECGSGELVGKCECGSKNAMQTYGVEFDSFSKIVNNLKYGH